MASFRSATSRVSNSLLNLYQHLLAALENGTFNAVPQRADGVTYAAKIDKKETGIDFTRPAAEVHNHIRGLSPFPGAWCEATPQGGKPERLKILRSTLARGHGEPGTVLDDALTIACGDGAVRLLEVQRAGKRAKHADFCQMSDLPDALNHRALSIRYDPEHNRQSQHAYRACMLERSKREV